MGLMPEAGTDSSLSLQGEGSAQRLSGRTHPLPNPLPEGRGDRSELVERPGNTPAIPACTDNSLSLQGEGGGEGNAQHRSGRTHPFPEGRGDRSELVRKPRNTPDIPACTNNSLSLQGEGGGEGNTQHRSGRTHPLPNPLPEGRGDRSELVGRPRNTPDIPACTNNSLSLQGEGGGEGNAQHRSGWKHPLPDPRPEGRGN